MEIDKDDAPETLLSAIEDDENDIPDLGMVGLQGHIDAIEGGRVYGWAWNPEHATEHVEIDIYFRQKRIGGVTANRFRQDLADIGMGDGTHAFVFDMPSEIRGAEAESVAAYFTETKMPLARGKRRKFPRPDKEPNPVDNLIGRIDRLEASLQQIFRALHIYRRGESKASQSDVPSKHENVLQSIDKLLQRQEQFEAQLHDFESVANALQTFVDQFKIDLYDKVTRGELDDLKTQHRIERKIASIIGFSCAAAISAAIILFLYY